MNVFSLFFMCLGNNKWLLFPGMKINRQKISECRKRYFGNKTWMRTETNSSWQGFCRHSGKVWDSILLLYHTPQPVFWISIEQMQWKIIRTLSSDVTWVQIHTRAYWKSPLYRWGKLLHLDALKNSIGSLKKQGIFQTLHFWTDPV